jgi:predicted secreted protein
MSIASAIVLFMVIWFLTFLIVIPIRIQTQGDLNEVVPGTHAGSPEHHNLKKKAWITTGISFVLWIIIGGTIISGVISVRDVDLFERMGPGESMWHSETEDGAAAD